MTDSKSDVQHVEIMESNDRIEPVLTMGTVKLTDGVIVYIPTPTADPQGQ